MGTGPLDPRHGEGRRDPGNKSGREIYAAHPVQRLVRLEPFDSEHTCHL